MTRALLSLKYDDTTDFVSKFKIVAEKVAGYFIAMGLAVKPYHDESLPYYTKLSTEKKKEALLHLEIYANCIEACLNSGENFKNGSKSLWFALKELGYIPNKDMFSRIRSNHVLEIYTDEKIQIWRDYNLMTYCTYTLEEIFAYPWTERYIRDQNDIQAIINASEQAFHPDNHDTIEAMIESHSVIEKFSEQRLDLTVAHDYFCPLFEADRSSPTAIVIISRVKINGRLEPVDGFIQRLPSTPPNTKPNLSLV